MSREATPDSPTLCFKKADLTCRTIGEAYEHPRMVQFLQTFNEHCDVEEKSCASYTDTTMEQLKNDPTIAKKAYDFFMEKLVLTGTNAVLDEVKAAAGLLLESVDERIDAIRQLKAFDNRRFEFTKQK